MIKLKDILLETTVNPGSKQYFKNTMSDDEVLKLSDILGKFPHTRLKDGAHQQLFLKDIGNILGYPANPTDVLTYTDGVGYPDKSKMKMNPQKSRLFQMYKSGKLTMKEYGEIQKPLMRRYIQLVKQFAASLTWRRF